MADQREVTCINKQDRYNPWERIINVGGVNWKMSQPEAIRLIEQRTLELYVMDRKLGKTVWVIVRTSQHGNKYLTTEADGESQNNLLSLPECR